MHSLILVRHGLAGSNRDGLASCTPPGEGLTDEGVEQARRLQAELAADAISLGVATELARTQETLELALAGRDVPRVVIGELNEIDFGAFDGGLLATYREWAAANGPAAPPPGGGESRAVAAARLARGLGRVLERPEEVVLLVAHSLVVRYTLDAARGLAPARLVAPVEFVQPHRVGSVELEAAAELLEAWSRAPRFRDPSNEG